MNKTFIILKREYLTRVRKKSFIITTIFGPLLIFLLFYGYNWFTHQKIENTQTIAVLDKSNLFLHRLKNNQNINFEYVEATLQEAKNNFPHPKYDAVLYIPSSIASNSKANIYSYKQVSYNLADYIAIQMQQILENEKLQSHEIKNLDKILKSIQTKITIKTVKWNDKGDSYETNLLIPILLSYLGGILIYSFIMLYNSMLMRGIAEEKINRIVEILLSSVKPFQLLMGKIIGIASVGLTQFSFWVLIMLTIFFTVQTIDYQKYKINDKLLQQQTEINQSIQQIPSPETTNLSAFVETLQSINFTVVVFSFLIYFILGYLLYSSIFAVIGSMVDTETDTQQFIFPITIPLTLSIILLMKTIEAPDSSLSVLFSLIPFTSPIIMIARIPFGVPIWQVILSLSLLALTFILITYLSAKIYKATILTYGSKLRFKDIIKILKKLRAKK